MAPHGPHGETAAQAERIVGDIMRAAMSWAKEVPAPLHRPIRAVCVRLAEMVADQRHYAMPADPDPSRAPTVLELVAEKLRRPPVTSGIEQDLLDLEERELRATASWSLVANPHAEWLTTAIAYLEACGRSLPQSQRPDEYWADDVVGGIVMSVKAILGTDDLHSRIEEEYGGRDRERAGEGGREREEED
jgi:hypothetical protein